MVVGPAPEANPNHDAKHTCPSCSQSDSKAGPQFESAAAEAGRSVSVSGSTRLAFAGLFRIYATLGVI
nr:MAG TPA: Preprotein translocase subunit SecE, Preprotein, archaeal, ribosomal, 50S, protein.0A [Caudoviricetes sp.]